MFNTNTSVNVPCKKIDFEGIKIRYLLANDTSISLR